MKPYSKKTNAIVTAISPISHGMIRAQNETDDKGENNIIRFRKLPMLLPDGEDLTPREVFYVSGNAMRGLGRRHMFYHTFQDVLELEFDTDILKDFDPLHRKFVVNLFENGGSMPKDSSAAGGVTAETYLDVLAKNPFLDLLGGVYVTHHFNGSIRVGGLILRTAETQQFFADKWKLFKDAEVGLPKMQEVQPVTLRFTKYHSNLDASMFPKDAAESKEDKANRKSNAIYGTEVLPVGSTFYWQCALVGSHNEGTALAYDAFLALLAQKGYIGGMSGKGCGFIRIQFDDINVEEAIQKYDDFLLQHKDNVIQSIRSIAEDFKYTLKESASKSKGKGKAKKGEDNEDAE